MSPAQPPIAGRTADRAVPAPSSSLHATPAAAIVTADACVPSAPYSNVTGGFAFLSTIVSYDANDVYLDLFFLNQSAARRTGAETSTIRIRLRAEEARLQARRRGGFSHSGERRCQCFTHHPTPAGAEPGSAASPYVGSRLSNVQTSILSMKHHQPSRYELPRSFAAAAPSVLR